MRFLAPLFGGGRGRASSDRVLTREKLAWPIQAAVMTRENEIGCDECLEQLDRFAELTLAGKSAAEAMPLVEDHLRRCGDCREEFEALLVGLRRSN